MVDLHCHSCYSFLDGASQPEELVQRAFELGYTALALTDHNGLYASLEFATKAKEHEIQPITGAEVTLEDESHLTLLVENPTGYANLCRLLSTAHRESERLKPRLRYETLAAHASGLIALSGCSQGRVPQLLQAGQFGEAEYAAAQFREWFGADSFFLELQQNLVYGDEERCRALAGLGRALNIPLVGTNNTHYHVRARWRLQDTMVAIREGLTLDEAHRYRRPNSEFALKHPRTLRARFHEYPQALENALTIAERCASFDITQDLGYNFPDFQREEGIQGATASETLRQLCWKALEVKYRDSSLDDRKEAERRLKRELDLVDHHRLAGFFLVYRDLLQMAKEVAANLRGTGPRGQFDLPPGRGRGSAVSSIICYLIGLSGVDPVVTRLFPGRFLNDSLSSVPDIDIDFPRDIRKDLIELVHQRYGADHVGMVCIFPTYRYRGAVREIGKALALPPAEMDRLAKLGDNYAPVTTEIDNLEGLASHQEAHRWRLLRELQEELKGMPRHLSQHVGGVVISSRPLVEIVPVQNSAMEGRQLIQWDKDGCDTARLIKVDFLGLGMLSAVEECLELIVANGKKALDLSRIPYTDRRIYERISRADTIGAFQVESRAQIGMLVRTRPQTMEQLAVQVAIVRPGPIVAGAVNPYVLRREQQRAGCLPRRLCHPLLEKTLADTLGIIIYQDQVMEVCKAMAGFTDGQADQLRRAMSRKRSLEGISKFQSLFMDGAAANGVREDIAMKTFEQVCAFSEFGFPKSHAAAFAVLAYQSVWLLHYYPTEFYAALLNNQPMGFYNSNTLVQEARRRGIRFHSPDVNLSLLGCTVHGDTIRLGLSRIKGVGKANAELVLAEREAGGAYLSPTDFVRRTRLTDAAVESLILVGAFDTMGDNRRELLWIQGLLKGHRSQQFQERTEAGSQIVARQPTLALPVEQDAVTLARAGRWERMEQEHSLLRVSLNEHPLNLLRSVLPPEIRSVREARRERNGSTVRVAGLVTTRQRPGTANGILFLLLEDETGMCNVVVSAEKFEAQRELLRTVPLILVEGRIQRRDRERNLLADRCYPLSEWLPDAKSELGRRVHEALRRWYAPPAHNFH